MNKKLSIVHALMILLLPIILYIYNLNSVVFDMDFYKEEFSKHDVYSNVDNAEKINDNVLSYLRYEKGNILIGDNFFTRREKVHLLDVKSLIQGTFFLQILLSVVFLILVFVMFALTGFSLKKTAEAFFIIVMFGSLLTLAETFLFFPLTSANFNFTFGFFHELFFPLGTYTFNPEFEKMVVLYPEGLFFDALIKILTKTILTSAIFFFLSTAVLFYFFKGNFLKKIFKNSRREKQ